MSGEVDHDGVHTSHCCAKHGCKYCDEACPVETGRLQQEHPCEDCPTHTWTVTPSTPALLRGKYAAGLIRDGQLVALVESPELAEYIAQACEARDVHDKFDQSGIYAEDEQ